MAAGGKAVVLRIKRKRTEDPLDAFLVAHSIKRRHVSENEQRFKTAQESSTVDKVYQLVGTVREGDESKKQELLEKLQSSRKSHSVKARLHNVQRIQEKLRRDKKSIHQNARFKVVGQHRSCNDSDESTEAGPQTSENISETDLEVQRMLSIYDVVKDDSELSKMGGAKKPKQDEQSQADGVNTILCNSVKMIREKLTVSNTSLEPDVESPFSTGEYVYDFYYPTDNTSPTGDIVQVLPFNESLVFQNMEEEFNEIYDDEDDSNDESNWRNDYPEEGHWESDESERRRHFGDYGFDSDEEYRRQAFQGADLSSDDDDLAYFGQRYTPRSTNTHTNDEVYHEELSDST